MTAIENFFTYPSPSFKGRVLVAALYAKSVFEMCGRIPAGTPYAKFTEASYPLWARRSCVSVVLCDVRRIAAWFGFCCGRK